MTTAKSFLALSDMLQDDPKEISAGKVRHIVDDILTDKWKRPTDAAIKVLASRLDLQRLWFRSSKKTWAEHNRLVQATTDALRSAQLAMNNLLVHLEDMRKAPDWDNIHLLIEPSMFGYPVEDRHTFLTSATKHITELLEAPQVAHISPPQVTKWRDLAIQMFTDFREAMASTNAKVVGISEKGPAALFLAAVIPLVTGETPSNGNVAEHLKTMRIERNG